MKQFTVELKEEYPFLQGGVLEGLTMSNPWDNGSEYKRPALIVVPGGAYYMTSRREGAPIASAFYAQGFQVFVLWYMTAPDGVRYPEQLLELSSAVDYVKKNADEFFVNKDEIFVVGFSAGGHLTANLAVDYFNASEIAGTPLDAKPTAVGLGYPVISDKYGHVGSYTYLLQGYSDEEKKALMSKVRLDKRVTKKTAPAFIWSTATDETVPPANAMQFALALAKKGVSYELHVYPEGKHGLATGRFDVNDEVPEMQKISRWTRDCASYFRRFTKEKY